ncbi:C4-dicarboxylic acid transporter DauA [Bowmanella denitrificans]|uniref:C4-dicarboxylic acid transporter DauA n=1 Tax=Bowmanella denitrificans TaxID=366582 RepID=UPI000C99BA51|nr:C4-dicarboxylic acid transporter DauA [Bowmanella denitrificans]
MPYRVHLFSLRIAHAFRETCLSGEYNLLQLRKDLLAGLSVGIIAIPLAMALAIASGVAPQHGLYTAIIGGFVIALCGGSRLSISGPTAAFIVLLVPITSQYGLVGLLLTTFVAGIILVMMAILRLGRFIEYIPESVVLGFTCGIALVIAILQVKDVLGLPLASLPDEFIHKIPVLLTAIPDMHWPSLLVAAVTLFIMIVWPRLRLPLPGHLPALVVASVLAFAMHQAGFATDTIGSRFSYALADGTVGMGIPAAIPTFQWPWQHVDKVWQALTFDWQLVKTLLPAAFAIAMLGAIESLLCAVVLDGMSGQRHSANSELLGQGIGNMIVPFFGGITATAALARSAANVRAGAVSPLSAMFHSATVFAALLMLTDLLNFVPMAAMAALLLVVAWNMSEAHKAIQLVKTAPRTDIWVFLTCFLLTVALDMVIAITAGILLAAMLFVKDIAEMTKITDITQSKRLVNSPLPDGWSVFKINGPLFFAAADRIFAELSTLCEDHKGFVLYLDGVTILDAGGLAALNKLISQCQRKQTQIYIADLQFQPLRALAKAGVKPIAGVLTFYSSLADALDNLADIKRMDSALPELNKI